MADEKQTKLKQQGTETLGMTRSAMRSSRQKRQRNSAQVEQETPKKQFWVQIRLLPIWLRIILVLLLLVGTAILGAMIGYGYIGDGETGDVLKKETWIHILDIINGKES